MNLDDQIAPGTQWVAMDITSDVIEYFYSFSLNCPTEVVQFSDNLGLNYLYNSTQYQNFMSVLYGCCCLYYVNELSKQKH